MCVSTGLFCFVKAVYSAVAEGKNGESDVRRYLKMMRTCSPPTFLDKHCICGHKMRKVGEPQTPVLQNPQQNFEKIKEDNSNGRKAS